MKRFYILFILFAFTGLLLFPSLQATLLTISENIEISISEETEIPASEESSQKETNEGKSFNEKEFISTEFFISSFSTADLIPDYHLNFQITQAFISIITPPPDLV